MTKTYDTARTPARRLLENFPDLLDDTDRNSINIQIATLNAADLARRVGTQQDLLEDEPPRVWWRV